MQAIRRSNWCVASYGEEEAFSLSVRSRGQIEQPIFAGLYVAEDLLVDAPSGGCFDDTFTNSPSKCGGQLSEGQF
jgi:hypothetical protein